MMRAKIVAVDLPPEIVENILSRLPVRSLARFRCVSKFWRCLIGSKRFIKTHIQNSTKNLTLSNHKIILDYSGPSDLKQLKQCSWSSLLNEPVVDSFVFDNHIDVHWNSINIRRSSINLVGCCNGLVCIVLDRFFLILWNPATRISKKLPEPFHVGCGNPSVYTIYRMNIFTKHGLGYDESSDDYKVVVIGHGVNVNNCGSVIRRDVSRIYSLKTNSWKTLKVKDVPSYHFHGVGKYASGNLHWSTSVGSNKEIVSFDFKGEVCGMVEQPSYLESPFCQSLGVMGGCLSLLCEYLDFDQLDVWVMMEYGVKESWSKVVAISNFPYPPIGEREVIRVFCRLSNGEIVLLCKSTLMIYNPKDNVFRHVKAIDVDSVFGADVCVESLVSLSSDAEAAPGSVD